MPREALPIKFDGVSHFSLNVLSGSYWWQLVLIIIGIVSSLLMSLGAYTRFSTFICWIIFLSFYNRNPLVVDGGDDALRIFLLLYCFFPTAVYFSLDRGSEKQNIKVPIAASLALIVQLGSIYFFSALLKTSPQWRIDGTALYYALALDVFTSKLGALLLNFPTLLKQMTLITWWAELVVPLFLLIPICATLFRTVAVFTFIGFHLGLAVFMDLGPFPWTLISVWIALLPSWLWETKLGNKVFNFLDLTFQKYAAKYPTNSSLEPTFQANILTSLFCFCFVVYITLWNIRSTDFGKYAKYFSPKLNFIGHSIRLDQYWALFAPRPTQDGGWDIPLGQLKNKTSVNLKTGKAPDFTRPKSTAYHYKDYRWKKHTLNTWQKINSSYRKYYANYLCKTWNDTHTGQYAVEEVKIIFMLEKTLPPGLGGYRAFPQPHVTWKQKCPS